MTDWQNDPLFHQSDTVPPDRWSPVAFSAPAFRVTIHSLNEFAHPLDHFEAYQDLFDLFRPVLQEKAERLYFVEKPGGKERKRKTIKAGDWEPLALMRSNADADPRYYGFYYHSGFVDYATHDPGENVFDKGPTRFLLWIGNSEVQIDITIAPEDFQTGRLDMARLKDVMARLPIGSATAGYGLALSDMNGGHAEALVNLVPIACRYPALDMVRYKQRSWDLNYDEMHHCPIGINWLTWVGEPFLAALGGGDKVCSGLPDAIAQRQCNGHIMFQLGDRPISGRRGVDDTRLPLYAALGNNLAPGLMIPPRTIPDYKRGFGECAPKGFNAAYENRFYGSDWFKEFYE